MKTTTTPLVRPLVLVCLLANFAVSPAWAFGRKAPRGGSPAPAADATATRFAADVALLREGKAAQAYLDASREFFELYQGLHVQETIERAAASFRLEYKEVVVEKNHDVSLRSHSAKGAFSLFFNLIRFGGSESSDDRSENTSSKTEMILQNAEAKNKFDNRVAADAEALRRELTGYVRDHADQILMLKMFGALATQAGTVLLQKGERVIVRTSDLEEILQQMTDVRFFGEQRIDLCVREKFAEQYFRTFVSHAESEGESIRGLLGSVSESSRDSSSDLHETWKLAHTRARCSSNSSRFEINANRSTYRIDFRVVERIAASWIDVAYLNELFGQIGREPVHSFGNPYLK